MKLITSTKAFRVALVIVASFSFQGAAGQYVTIPDPNFATWLQSHGYGGCMSGNLLDTTCSAVVNAIDVDCSLAAITTLDGIQYFDNLLYLTCVSNQLTELPPLPANLQSLYCGDNQIAVLPELPATLIGLNCATNLLTSLPLLPDGLESLTCGENAITSLPDPLPSSLYELSCNDNLLYYLPEIPPGVTFLFCGNFDLFSSGNQLSNLPALPEGLVSLYVANAQLTELPELPDSLDILVVDGNEQLSCLPPLNNLLYLYFENTAIGCVPTPNVLVESLPDFNTFPACGSLAVTSTPDGSGSYLLSTNYPTSLYFYWSTGEMTPEITVTDPDLYSVTVNPLYPCQETAGITVGSQFLLTLDDVYVPWCNWTTTFLSPVISGGDAPYSYIWSTAETADQIGNLLEGVYSVTVTDANGLTASEDAFVTAPDSGLGLGGTYYDGDPNCNSYPVSMGPDVLGGVQPYSFLWSNGQTTPTIIIEPAEVYDVTVTDADGCTVSSTGNGTGYAVTLDNIASASCGSGADGAIYISITDPFFAGPFTYTWSNGATTEDVIGLAGGTYTVTITPVGTCADTLEFLVPSSGGFSLSTDVTNAGCGLANGAIDLSVTGGTAPFSYLWSNADASEDIANLSAGTYSVSVVDANFCTGFTTATVLNGGTCDAPTNPIATVNNTTAVILWDAQPCAVKYRVLVKQMGAGGGPWVLYIVNAPDINLTLTGLIPGKTYKYKVRAVCSPTGTVLSPWSVTNTFVAGGAVTVCAAPSGIAANNETQTSADVTWTPVSGSYGYQLRYRIQGTATWTPVVISNGTLGLQTLTGLSANTAYEFQMRTKCSTSPLTWSGYSSVQMFVTPLRLAENEIANDLRVYPNPADKLVNVELDEQAPAMIEMISIEGKVLNRIPTVSSATIDVSRFANGFYILRITTANGEHHERIVIQH